MLDWSILRRSAFIAIAVGVVLVNWQFREVWSDGPSASANLLIDDIEKPIVPVRTGRNDCGPLCLYLICKAEGQDRPIEELRRLVNTTDEGNSLLDLKIGASKLGFDASAVNLSFVDLRRYLGLRGHYAIVHLPKQKHFSPAIAVSGEHIVFADPGYGLKQLSSSHLVNHWEWKGDALLIRAPEAIER